MRKIITILLLSLISLSAQPFNINYSFKIESCDGSGEYELFSGLMQEGESFVYPAVSLPLEYIQAQFLYNVFVDAEFGIPAGSLDENIDLNISLGDFWCNLNFEEFPIGVHRLFSIIVEIVGENSGSNPENYYWFKDNKEAFIKIKTSKIAPFTSLLGIDDFNEIKVYYSEGASINRNDIRREIIGDRFVIFPQHFSTLSAGLIDETTDVENISSLPSDYKLIQNYPNPFNPSTIIGYSLFEKGFTKLSVFNSIGQEIETLINEHQNAGKYNINFDASNLPSGLYFYTITSDNFTQTKKMMLLK